MLEGLIPLFKESFFLGLSATLASLFAYLLYHTVKSYKQSIDTNLSSYENILSKAREDLEKHRKKTTEANNELVEKIHGIKYEIIELKSELNQTIQNFKRESRDGANALSESSELFRQKSIVMREIGENLQNLFGRVILLEQDKDLRSGQLKKVAEILREQSDKIKSLKGDK